MCGIAVIVNANGTIAESSIRQMVHRQAHRGPDASRWERLRGCDLGHVRLSIIDLSSGDQPMSDVSGRYRIVLNGEIYNYRELRRELSEMGRRFATHSDTEVVLAAYQEWGSECLQRFRGMFAFALWDTKEQTLFAARDLFGEKPLYYAIGPGNTLLISSEIKGILASDVLQPQLDLSAVDAFLILGYVPPNRTIYSNIYVLPPGHFLSWDADKAIAQKRPYWVPSLQPKHIDLDEAAEQLRDHLRRAVRRQLVADVPVGAFLSGGLDSSTIVALMRESSSNPIKTFSVGFGEFINELPYARAVAERYETEHYDIDLGQPPVDQMIQRMAEVYDEPFSDSSHIPTFMISEFARSEVKVVLSGDGGDELFGGYWWYLPLAMSEQVSASKWKWIVLRMLSKLIGHRHRWLSVYSGGLGQAVRWPNCWERRRNSRMIFNASQRRRLWGPRVVESYTEGQYFRPAVENGIDDAFFYDLTSYLPGDILVKVDRAAMAHGLETRAPFLDRDLVEFALSLPVALKVQGTESKILLRHACQQYWPPELRKRTKQGFGGPVDVWLKQPGVQSLIDRVFHPSNRLCQLLPGIDSNQRLAHDYQTWTLLTLGLWLEQYKVAA